MKKFYKYTNLICLLFAVMLLFSGCGALSASVDTLREIKNDAVASYTVGEPEIVDTVSGEKYAYSCLNDDEKVIYDQVLDAILNYKEEITLATLDKEVLNKAYYAVMADYGGLFWVSGYKYNTFTSGSDVVGLTFNPNFTMTDEERHNIQDKIDVVVEDWLSGIATDASDYEKSKFVYETLIDNVEYDTASDDNQNIISVFINRSTVCQGYADAVSYLLTELGIQSTVVTGTAGGGAHAWNLIRLDGAYYYMDATWGNSRYQDPGEDVLKHINYAYLNVTSEEMSTTHTVEMDIPMPECAATEDNYFYHEGKYFDTWDPSAVGEIYGQAKRDGKQMESVKFGNIEIYRKCVEYLIKDSHIADFCPGITSIMYVENEDACVLSIIY